MKVVIKTGFEKVTHNNLSFHPESEPKGKKLVESDHVRDVCEFREFGISYLIEARVIRQTAVLSTPYSTKLFIGGTREVLNVSCTCVYNKSKACKHIAALIHFIINKESQTKTNFEQQWGAPTAQQFAKKKYSKGKYFYVMFKPDDELDINSHDVNIEKLQAPSAFKVMLVAADKRKKSRSNDDEKIRDLINSMLAEVDSILENEKVENCLNFLFALFDKQVIQYTLPTVQREHQQFYNRSIVLSEQEIIELCCNTLKQSDSSEWFKARRLRISTSKNAHSIKSRKTKSIDKLISEMLYPQNSVTRYGEKMEPVARKEYERITGTDVQQLGVIVCKSKPWLCASLDGVVIKESCPTKIVEIKCPVSCAKLPIVDDNSKKANVTYLQLDNKNPVLKKSSIIYTQCQIQMYISGFSQCDLFVYSPIKSFIISVFRNEKFLENILLTCEQFYFQHYLPALQKCIENETTLPKRSQVRTFTGKDVSNILQLNLLNNM